MSKFYPGQRVRIVRVKNVLLMHLEGAETFIVDRAPALLDRSDWLVALRNSAGRYLGASESNLEPILPDGLESPEQIASLWEPSPEVVTQ